VKYIDSDLLGLLSDRHLTIAGTGFTRTMTVKLTELILIRPIYGSCCYFFIFDELMNHPLLQYGTLDPLCMELAALCSQSVDFSKNGGEQSK